jgi:hypothetical protein
MWRKISAGHTGTVRNMFKILVEKSGKLGDHLVDLGVKVRIILRLVIEI